MIGIWILDLTLRSQCGNSATVTRLQAGLSRVWFWTGVEILHSITFRPALTTTQAPHSTGTMVLFWGVQQPVHAIDFSPPFIGEVKNE
jgi:hypothetical protein